jgi:hypothetical protein
MALELAKNSGSRGGAAVVWLALHTAEGGYDSDPADYGIDAGSAQSLVDFFRRSIGTNDPKSCHAIADDDVLIDNLVDYGRKAYTLRNGNPRSDNLEQMGLAKWDRPTWLTHDGLLTNAARWITSRAKARGWSLGDIRHLSVAEVRAGNVRGVIVHFDYTQATGDGEHWDCGPGYPIDVVIARARAIFQGETPTSGKDWFDMADKDDLKDAIREVFHLPAGGVTVPAGKANNSGMYADVLNLARTNFNAQAGLAGIVAAVKADTALQGDDEAKVLAKLAEIEALLAPAPAPTPGA